MATVNSRLQQFGDAARQRMRPGFDAAHVAYPPKELVFVALKQERILEIYASDGVTQPRRVARYSIQGASGGLGPKLREGDRQVPEGIYHIELLNPNSSYHVSLRIGYPNKFDLEKAALEGRTSPGTDIMIHGGNLSVGCLAMGDDVAEEIFTLAADVGIKNITVVMSPVDFRAGKTVPSGTVLPSWIDEVYGPVKARLAELPLTEKP